MEGKEREGRRGEVRRDGKEGKGRGEWRGREGVHSLRKTTPVIRWLVTGLKMVTPLELLKYSFSYAVIDRTVIINRKIILQICFFLF